MFSWSGRALLLFEEIEWPNLHPDVIITISIYLIDISICLIFSLKRKSIFVKTNLIPNISIGWYSFLGDIVFNFGSIWNCLILIVSVKREQQRWSGYERMRHRQQLHLRGGHYQGQVVFNLWDFDENFILERSHLGKSCCKWSKLLF